MTLDISNKSMQARRAIHSSNIMNLLVEFKPTEVSTISVGLDTSESDIDIICCYRSQPEFYRVLKAALSVFSSKELILALDYTLGRFKYLAFEFEIFGSNQPIHDQRAYKHHGVMKRLVGIGGIEFQTAIRELKQSGLKTEPAIACYLGLIGDPYESVLELAHVDDHSLLDLVSSSAQ